MFYDNNTPKANSMDKKSIESYSKKTSQEYNTYSSHYYKQKLDNNSSSVYLHVLHQELAYEYIYTTATILSASYRR